MASKKKRTKNENKNDNKVVKKIKTEKSESAQIDIDEGHNTSSENLQKQNQANTNKFLDWEMEDLNILVNNLAKCLPKNDNVKYSTLIEKLDWEKVRFGRFSAQECKDKWNQIMYRLRRYRTLTDMVTDARVWLKAPWQTYNNVKKIKHPDFPKKPLTPFFRYFMEKRLTEGKSHPDLSVTDLAKSLSVKFRNLNEKKKKKYKEAYEKEYEEYKVKLDKFKTDHPEFGKMAKHLAEDQEGPPKPKTPYNLFFEEKIKKEPKESQSKKEVIDKIKSLWANLSEGKRIKWIRRAIIDEQRYEEEVLRYIAEHPNFEPKKLKPVLTKSEKELKDKFDGKPEKPPTSGYSLFSKILLRDLKDIPAKEKMVVIAKKWKEQSDEDRSYYNKEAQKAMSKYVEKFETYLNQLPESERIKVMNETKFKLPNEKKLKQQVKENKSPNEKTNKLATDDDHSAREQAAMLCFQLERTPDVKAKNPTKSKNEITKIVIQEWKEKLPHKKKTKFYKMAESIVSVREPKSKSQSSTSSPSRQPPKSSNKSPKKSPAYDFIKTEPKKPPKSGYSLFSSEQLSSLTEFEPKKRMQEIARKWNNELDPKQKQQYDHRAKELFQKYQKNLNDWIDKLKPDEKEKYDEFADKRKNKGRKGKKAKEQTPEKLPEIIGISTLQYEASDDEDENEKYDTPQDTPQGQTHSESEEEEGDEAEEQEEEEDEDEDDEEDEEEEEESDNE